MPHTPTTAGDRPRRPDEDVVDWAVETGRVSARTAPDWRASIRAGVTKPETIEGLASCMVPGVGPAGSLPSANAGRQVSAAVDAIGRPGASRAHARNPLVDAARAAAPGMTVRAAAAATSTPTLFSTGDLPAFTASGIDPNLLLQVPWQARHAMAAATSTQAAYAILAECTGPDGPDAAELNYSGDDGNRQYAKRVEQWVGAAMTDEENYTSLFGEEA